MTDAIANTNGQLKAIIKRIQNLNDDKKAIASDIKDVYGEAKANGFDTKAVRAVVRLLEIPVAERQEAEAIVDLYMGQIGAD